VFSVIKREAFLLRISVVPTGLGKGETQTQDCATRTRVACPGLLSPAPYGAPDPTLTYCLPPLSRGSAPNTEPPSAGAYELSPFPFSSVSSVKSVVAKSGASLRPTAALDPIRPISSISLIGLIGLIGLIRLIALSEKTIAGAQSFFGPPSASSASAPAAIPPTACIAQCVLPAEKKRPEEPREIPPANKPGNRSYTVYVDAAVSPPWPVQLVWKNSPRGLSTRS